MSLVSAKNITKSFNNSKAIDSIDLEVLKGKITGLVGPDGAGKTTLIRLMTGLLIQDSGALTVLGFTMPEHSKEVQSLIGYMPQKFGLYEDLSVEENLNLYANLQSIDKKRQKHRIDELLNFTSLFEFKSFLASELSGGMKQKLGLACALIKKPKLLLLDEPTTGLSMFDTKVILKLIVKLQKKVGYKILFVTHDVDASRELCQEIAILKDGIIIETGSVEDVLKNPQHDYTKELIESNFKKRGKRS